MGYNSLAVCARRGVAGLEHPLVCEECPHNPGCLVRQRYRSHILVASRDDLDRPALRFGTLCGAVDHGAGAVDQQRSQVCIAALAHAQQRWLATARVLTRHHAEPGRELATVVEVLRVADAGYQRGGGQRPDARHLLQTPARILRKYLPKRPAGRPRGDQRWSTFLRNHARAILACDFFVTVTATFRLLYVFVVIEHGTRRLAHFNVTARASAAWTLQQLQEVIGQTDHHKYLIHDRDSIFAEHLDDSIRALGLSVLRSPFASPKANAICERGDRNDPA